MEYATDSSSATLSDTLATWNAPRSTSELRSFISRHEDALDVEDFDL